MSVLSFARKARMAVDRYYRAKCELVELGFPEKEAAYCVGFLRWLCARSTLGFDKAVRWLVWGVRDCRLAPHVVLNELNVQEARASLAGVDTMTLFVGACVARACKPPNGMTVSEWAEANRFRGGE